MKSIPEVLAEVLGAFERLGTPYVVGGSFASSVWGHPRQTRDLDVSLWLEADKVQSLVSELEGDYMISAEELTRTLHAREEYRSFQILHYETLFKVDAFVPHETAFTEAILQTSRKVEIVPGLLANCMSPEAVVIQKLRWFELGNRVSDRQWNDIVQVLEVQRGRLDETSLSEWASHFNLTDLLLQAKRQAGFLN